jgi:hypothetical protein
MKHFLFIPLSLLFVSEAMSQVDQGTQRWQQYVNVDEAGFSKSDFDSLTLTLEDSESAALLVIFKGNVLFSYGDNVRRYALHSMRKGIMNAMIGIEAGNDSISPETLKHRSEFQNRLVQVFLLKSNEITHPNPEQAVKYGLFVIASTARDGILFDRSPHALSAAVEFNAIKHELSQMLYAHLTHSESPGIHNNAS